MKQTNECSLAIQPNRAGHFFKIGSESAEAYASALLDGRYRSGDGQGPTDALASCNLTTDSDSLQNHAAQNRMGYSDGK